MADVPATLKNGNGVAFLVSAGIVMEIIAAMCSSPQTTEINAGRRAGTLMKWVYIGEATAVLFIGIAAYVDKEHRNAILVGGGLALVIMHAAYVHGKRAGLGSGKPGTED